MGKKKDEEVFELVVEDDGDQEKPKEKKPKADKVGHGLIPAGKSKRDMINEMSGKVLHFYHTNDGIMWVDGSNKKKFAAFIKGYVTVKDGVAVFKGE